MTSLRTKLASSLKQFQSSSLAFQVLHTVPADSPASPVSTLYVLDSSFNPPTRAHLTIARAALLQDHGRPPCRLILLLATQNADKPPQPADFPDRLAMMTLLAENLRQSLIGEKLDAVPVDIAVSTRPYFMDKAAAIAESAMYGSAQQVHLVGYDTVIRIFDSKYYPQEKKLGVLDAFLGQHRLRVCYRSDEVGRDEQEKYVAAIGDGSREDEGMRREWIERVELVDDAAAVKGISSTKAREAAGQKRSDELTRLVGDEIAAYVIEQKLYG